MTNHLHYAQRGMDLQAWKRCTTLRTCNIFREKQNIGGRTLLCPAYFATSSHFAPSAYSSKFSDDYRKMFKQKVAEVARLPLWYEHLLPVIRESMSCRDVFRFMGNNPWERSDSTGKWAWVAEMCRFSNRNLHFLQTCGTLGPVTQLK